jgi:hypothetical protein
MSKFCRNDDSLESPLLSAASTRGCEIVIQRNNLVDKYTIFRLIAYDGGPLSLDVEEDCPFLFAGEVKVTSLIFLGQIPSRKVEELATLVMRVTEGQVANSVAWVRACVDKMVDAQLMAVTKRHDAIERLPRGAGRVPIV